MSAPLDIAAHLGDAKPATNGLIATLAKATEQVREHEHPKHEDIYCHNLLWYMGERMAPVLRRLLDAEARIAELEPAAVEARSALAALCFDLDDPGTAALGALYLLQQATVGTSMQSGETALTVYRASHESIVMGLYTTAAEARKHCETLAHREIPGATLDWIEDDEDRVAELVAAFGEDERSTGYIVTGLELASEYDEEADE
ncbi:hypothetical protein [Streptomyces sp. NPDC057302]|uniref:hypothetical protein n=1 Tax=Streptomyces sp. NPDC057302 TaxID=3346094 RepID=UPI003638C8D8